MMLRRGADAKGFFWAWGEGPRFYFHDRVSSALAKAQARGWRNGRR